VTTRDETLAALREKLGSMLLNETATSARRVFIEVKPADVVAVSRVFIQDMHARLQTASGVDTLDAFEILYHWAFDSAGFIVTARTKLDKVRPEIESISPLCKGAEWIEREMWELLGITFRNHPDMRHLLLMDEWPEGKYPLRRDYRNV
jgi:Ni,Fe-hydrogenase III component G